MWLWGGSNVANTDITSVLKLILNLSLSLSLAQHHLPLPPLPLPTTTTMAILLHEIFAQARTHAHARLCVLLLHTLVLFLFLFSSFTLFFSSSLFIIMIADTFRYPHLPSIINTFMIHIKYCTSWTTLNVALLFRSRSIHFILSLSLYTIHLLILLGLSCARVSAIFSWQHFF